MNNPVWEWLIRTRINAYQAKEALQGPSSLDAGPGWCFDRFGQSSTSLPDGRVVLIAGEHEDYYDPDFHIYNDVVVQHPDGNMDLFGYPREIFPPTDFHSATVVGERMIIIGNLGYPADRRPGKTQVLLLDLKTFEISAASDTGNSPGWIYNHTATLSKDGRSILISKGKVDLRDDSPLVENIDDWRLNLDDWHWERLTERNWPRWEVRREDGKTNHLFDYQMAAWDQDLQEVRELVGKEPDLKLFAERYRPPVEHDIMPKVEGEFGVHRIKVNEVTIRYVEDLDGVQMTVEGELSAEILGLLTRDLLEKMTTLENVPCKLIKL